MMKFYLSGIDGNRKEMTEMFLTYQGYECVEKDMDIIIEFTEGDVLKAEFDGKKLNLYGKEDVHFYRALHLFLQRIKYGNTEPFVKEEKICFKETGIMIDCSRNGTVNKPMLKEFIRLCAASGMNQLYLYMEDVYEVPGDPYFGAYRGKYTYGDLKELDEYGNKAGVELIPAIQTLAHLHTYLRWPKTKKLRDTEDILMVGTKDTEEFVRKMIQSASGPFTSKKIHVGMDEADLLGLGQYLRNNGFEERYGIMTKHLQMVSQICAEEGLEMMLWSDMFFRLKSPDGEYYDLPEDTDFDLSKPLPKDLTLVYWDYYHHDKGMYDKNIRLHRKLTDKIRFAGGGWTWNGIAPNYSKAEKTLREGLASCRDQSIDKVMCTFWFDNGTETPVRTAFYSALYFAELCYSEEMDTEQLDRWLMQLTGYTSDAYHLLDAFDNTPGVKKDNENADNPSKYLLYQDVLTGLFDGQIAGLGLDMGQYYKKLAKRLEDLLNEKSKCYMDIENKYSMDIENKYSMDIENKVPMDAVFRYYNMLAEILSQKAMSGIEIRKAYRAGDRETLVLLADRIQRLLPMVSRLKAMREELWFSECRPFGFEVLDIRIGGVMVRLESAEKRLRNYLEGKADILEELEEPMIVYQDDPADDSHKMCMGGFWQGMVSAGNIAGI